MGKGRERFASVTRKTVVWWDINSCPVPDGVDPGDVRALIESALPGSDFEPEEVTIFAIGNLLCVPGHHNKAISSSGIFMRQGHFGINDTISEICWWKRENPPPATIIVITEDPDREQVYLLLSNDSSGGKYTVLSLRWENLIKETTHHDRSHMLEDSKCTLRRWGCALCWFQSHTFCGFANHLYGSYHAKDLAASEINIYHNFQNDLKREEASVRELILQERRVHYFWLSAFKNNKIAAKEITERDEGALKYLKAFKWKMVEKPPTKGLKLKFLFTKNPYFNNTVLTKTYPTIDKDEPFFAKAIGTEIEWYPGKCLTQKHKARKKKGSKQITETEDCESFFNFFSPLQVPHSSKGLDDDTMHKWEHDYAIRCAYLTLALKVQAQLDLDKMYTDSLHGVPWFTVEADDLEMEDSDDDLVMEERTSTKKKKNEIKEAFCKRSLQAQGIAVEIEGDGDEDEHEEEESDQGRDVQKKSSGTRNLEEVNLQRVSEVVLGEKPSWLSALKDGEIAAKEITERDEGALKYLKGIEWKVVEKPPTKGLKLKFFFMKNPYFKNTVLEKTYPTIDKDEPFFAKATGTEIEWYPGKCLTQKHKVVKKKGSKQITETEDCESFFNFFSPFQVPHSSKGLDGDTIHKWEHDFAIRYALIFLALDPQGLLDHDNCYPESDMTFAVFSPSHQIDRRQW